MKQLVSLCLVSTLLSSCSTYLIPVESFKNQFAGMKETDMKEVMVQGPLGERTTYKTFPQDSVDCTNKKGQRVRLEKIPSLEIRFTDVHNRKTVYYFDRIFVTDTTVIGTYSRILGLQKAIPLETIKKVELQNGSKNYRYVH
jgi:hypothetical protein